VNVVSDVFQTAIRGEPIINEESFVLGETLSPSELIVQKSCTNGSNRVTSVPYPNSQNQKAPVVASTVFGADAE
jgi:hypothetical protein